MRNQGSLICSLWRTIMPSSAGYFAVMVDRPCSSNFASYLGCSIMLQTENRDHSTVVYGFQPRKVRYLAGGQPCSRNFSSYLYWSNIMLIIIEFSPSWKYFKQNIRPGRSPKTQISISWKRCKPDIIVYDLYLVSKTFRPLRITRAGLSWNFTSRLSLESHHIPFFRKGC